MTTHTQAQAFADNPAEYFHFDINEMGSIDRSEMEALQLSALQIRFDALRNEVPMLKKLADEQDINALDCVEDAVPLLFEHTMYKSYPASLLEKGRFAQINKWLNKLTSHDISEIDVSHCRTIDDWLGVMEAESPLRLTHSSGTSGTMSFLPHSADEYDALGQTMTVSNLQRFGEAPSDDPVQVIFPHFRSGYGAMLRGNDIIVKYIAKGEENFHAAYPGHMSSDVLYLAARIRAAQAKGALDRLKINDEMMARKKEFEQIEAEMPHRIEAFYAELFKKLEGQRIYTTGTWNLLHNMATQGLEQGQEALFASNSIVLTGGGAKGITPPPNWQEDVCRFLGIPALKMGYGMSEVFAINPMCSQGRYHLLPWVIPFILDPETSVPLPRKGVVTGRAAFFGLLARHAWGGFITGDEVTIDWDSACPCGQTTWHLDPMIQRFTDKTGDDDKITCAATPGAHQEAMTFLANLDQ